MIAGIAFGLGTLDDDVAAPMIVEVVALHGGGAADELEADPVADVVSSAGLPGFGFL